MRVLPLTVSGMFSPNVISSAVSLARSPVHGGAFVRFRPTILPQAYLYVHQTVAKLVVASFRTSLSDSDGAQLLDLRHSSTRVKTVSSSFSGLSVEGAGPSWSWDVDEFTPRSSNFQWGWLKANATLLKANSPSTITESFLLIFRLDSINPYLKIWKGSNAAYHDVSEILDKMRASLNSVTWFSYSVFEFWYTGHPVYDKGIDARAQLHDGSGKCEIKLPDMGYSVIFSVEPNPDPASEDKETATTRMLGRMAGRKLLTIEVVEKDH